MNEQNEKCITSCGFYANSNKNGYCSFCWKNITNESVDLIRREDSDKCEMCSKRIGLLGFLCKCGKKYCGLHRHAETHKCGTDFKREKRLQLEQSLCTIKPNKINKLP